MNEKFLIWVAFVSASAAAFFYYSSALRQQVVPDKVMKKLAEQSFLITLIAGIIASILLIYYFLSHQFQYTYVFRYSSTDLPMVYLISAFWAGQEGTILLWAVLVGVLGMFFKRVFFDNGYALALVSLFVSFLYLLLIVKSPFETSLEIPPDGAGLNPLLQDPWMAVHPPLLFVGYASTVFPFALAISVLIRREYSQWLNFGLRWTIVAAFWLGAGIIVGGFWAYEVLGWGGYWGWDPVENSSLIPWITLLALIHGLIVQKEKGSLVKTNIFLAIVTFVLVLYATFLTRSGILANFSVHSFVDLGINNYLIGAIIVTLLLGAGLFITRYREMNGPKVTMSSWNREFTLSLSIIALSTSGFLTIVGTSSPLITNIFSNVSQVEISYYNRVNLPIAIVIGFLLGITPYLSWMPQSFIEMLKNIRLPLLLTIASMLVAYALEVRTLGLFLFVGTAVFALWSNLFNLIRNFRVSILNVGAPLAHIGIALLFIGIVGSGSFDEEKTIVLKQGEPQSALGYQFTFKGVTSNPNKKDHLNIEVSSGKSSFLAEPKLYFSEYNRAVMREPYIKILPLKDLYISPKELRPSMVDHHHQMLEIVKGETKDIAGYKITFVGFEASQHRETGAIAVGAILKVVSHGKDHEVIPAITIDKAGIKQRMPAYLPPLLDNGTDEKLYHVTVNEISVEQKKILLEFHGFDDHASLTEYEHLVLQVNIKPLMLVVWAGVVLILLGTVFAFIRRRTANVNAQ